MALALLRPRGWDGEQVHLDIELGSNRFYSYAIGDGELDRSGGFAVLTNRKTVSELRGPIPDHPAGRASLAIPAAAFDRDNRYLQLASFRTADRKGPAFSEVLKVAPGAASRGDELPAIPTGLGSTMQASTQRQPAPFTYAEAQHLSSAMFLDGLLPFIQRALPVVSDLLPAIGGLFGIGAKGNGAASPAAAKPGDLIAQLLKLLEEVVGKPAATSGAKSLALGDAYSQAQIAPLLAAAPMLTQLMPLLQQVLTPETVKSLIGAVSPKEVIGAVTDSLKEVGKLGLENNKQLQDWLQKLAPSVDDAGLDRLLEGMSLQECIPLARSLGAAPTPEAEAAAEPRYRRVRGVVVDFTGAAMLLLRGRTRLCYRAGTALSFPLSVKTPRSIHDARLVLLVKDPSTRRILARLRVAIPEVKSGPLAPDPVLPAEELAALKPGQAYLVCAYLLWRDGQKKVLGTSRSQLITLVGRYSFDRTEEDGAPIPLGDVVKHRDWWHKVWQGSFTSDFRRISLECKYYVAFEPDRAAQARLETLTRLEEPVEHKLAGRLKTGFIATPAGLNQLIPLISTQPQLTGDELEALRSPDFQERFHQAARFKAELHGRPGTTAALWIYPEVKLQKAVLYEATKVGDDGQVREFAEHAIHVPVPVLLHYLGARTTS